jgi:hypothetical protein
MRWSRLAQTAAQTAKKTIDDRGGTEGLKRDAEQLREIARGHGSPKDKARRAAEALKQSDKRGGPAGDRPGHDRRRGAASR